MCLCFRITVYFIFCFFTTTHGYENGLRLFSSRLTLAFSDPDFGTCSCDSPWRTFRTRFLFQEVMEDLRCINCGIATVRLRRHTLESEDLQNTIRQWITPRTVTASDHLCHSCWTLANQQLPGPSNQLTEDLNPTVGHRHVCINCGRSLLRVRSHQLRNDSDRESHIHNIISAWIEPRQVQASSCICHPCWQRANRTYGVPQSNLQQDFVLPGPTDDHNRPAVVPEAEPTSINLPQYTRAVATQVHCFVVGCQGRERNRIPLNLRTLLLKRYKYYIPENSRICSDHLVNTSWDFLNEHPHNENHSFTASYIEDMMSLKKEYVIDFGNINDMPDHLVHYWLGRTKQQYNLILEEVPRLTQMHRGPTALAAYLIKIRTGDSDERISSLMQIPERTVASLISRAREYLVQDYVPLHVGLRHINREQIAARNLLIPNGLFGNEDRTKPIVIMDGTYIYVQKSSNYLYQKNTYSLHKYRNLVKMFIIVSTDGYIVEVLGPYPATTSDAEITKKEFNGNQPLRNYFQEGDVFILDRGFRDALPLLNECGYQVHKPESVQEGETQLTTLEANQTRAVTICRWVVEVINGRFKRDFKIFRQEYYNAASKNLMNDFSVAAALTNAFHPPINDREDAGEILNIIRLKMLVPNSLARIVRMLNLNRRRTNFRQINVDTTNVNDFPRLAYSELILISLGTYQLKQARSYYGEHIRANGTYTIEVCREVSSSLLGELSNPDHWLLRGKIQSRHVSRKIYFVYILVDSSQHGRSAIIQYYCNCIVGKRTVGCCAHIMTILWYLGWARYQNNIIPPAQHLDDILILYTEDDDVEIS